MIFERSLVIGTVHQVFLHKAIIASALSMLLSQNADTALLTLHNEIEAFFLLTFFATL